MNLFKRLFGSKSEKEDTEKTTLSTTTRIISKSELDKLKVGDTITLGNDNKITYESKWIKVSENPYQKDIFDCREYAVNMLSSTQNSEIANKFLQLRKSDGKEHIGQFPNNGTKCEVELNFNNNGEQLSDGIVFKAQTMEEKWDIYKYANFLFFVRSWTGDLVYFSNYIPTESGFKVDLIVLDGDKIDQKDPFFEFKVVEFLIHSHILNYKLPHPLPKSLENKVDNILAYSFSMFGNRGHYASYE
ncbi:hypothetical protein [Tenacibaculum ovolyticum]|uniref:hypothetical protein n=1 Tax=Tenacibaculum ovolyticum TaxID=104270 RepID=UPI0007EC68BB|nr:hypothetical protein [Tenacibaculum ovolyticum]